MTEGTISFEEAERIKRQKLERMANPLEISKTTTTKTGEVLKEVQVGNKVVRGGPSLNVSHVASPTRSRQ